MEAGKPSMESDNRHLLDSSRPASVYSYATTLNENQTPTQSTAYLPNGTAETSAGPVEQSAKVPYRGFSSKEAYLQALTEFAQERSYFKADDALIGFYHHKTMDEYMKDGQRKTGRRSKKANATSRRDTVPNLHLVSEAAEEDVVPQASGRRASLAQLGRRVIGRQSVA